MDDAQLLKAIKNVLYEVRNKTFLWRLDGSANLRVQGIMTAVNDVDICTNNDGFLIFKKLLAKKNLQEIENSKGRMLWVDLGSPVEIWSYADFTLRMLEKAHLQSWKGVTVPVLPLEQARTFYEKIRQLDKVELIRTHLAQQGKTVVL